MFFFVSILLGVLFVVFLLGTLICGVGFMGRAERRMEGFNRISAVSPRNGQNFFGGTEPLGIRVIYPYTNAGWLG